MLCNRAENRDRSFINDLWAISCETRAARLLSEGTLEIESCSWSPDGKLAMLVAAKDRRREGSSNAHLYLVSREGDCIEDLTAAIDNHATPAAFHGYYPSAPYTPRWSSDSKRIYFLVTERACINCYQLDRVQNTVTGLTSGERLIYYLSLLPGERGLVVAQGLPFHLLEVYLLPGANDDEIEGWVIRPIGSKEGVTYPLIVEIHGGPQAAFGVGLDVLHQYLAAQGFAIFDCNPHGWCVEPYFLCGNL